MLKVEAKFDRTCTFIALGGGVIGDLVGFAAAVYQRGIKFVQVYSSIDPGFPSIAGDWRYNDSTCIVTYSYIHLPLAIMHVNACLQ